MLDSISWWKYIKIIKMCWTKLINIQVKIGGCQQLAQKQILQCSTENHDKEHFFEQLNFSGCLWFLTAQVFSLPARVIKRKKSFFFYFYFLFKNVCICSKLLKWFLIKKKKKTNYLTCCLCCCLVSETLTALINILMKLCMRMSQSMPQE